MQINVTALQQAIAQGDGPTILDVREPWEVAIAAMPGSLNIPMSSIPARLSEIPRDTPVAVLCHHGMRSWQVTQWLRAQGFDQVVNIEGGIDDWAQTVDPAMRRY